MISGRTAVHALLGHPVANSPSPELHNGWFAEHGLDGIYVALDVDAASGPSIVGALRTLSLAGANVTVPLKEHVVQGVDRLELAAAAAGAVNTLWWDGPQLVGANTDGEGLCLALAAEGITIASRRAAVIGAGGAARGIASALLAAGVSELALLNRSPARAEAVADHLAQGPRRSRVRVGPIHSDEIAGVELLVSTIPGITGALERLDPEALAPGSVWYNVNYRNTESDVSSRARIAGHRVLDGWGMLCWQAALAFERWTGVRPDARAAYLRRTC
ncbi:MAG TPA: shikimate dehydrogenase [Deltaproteobacteria bacterium]|nr:shikimate dehydrogenase [Deltaproteobacteria bacterium]